MSQDQKIFQLQQHGVTTKIENGVLFAWDAYWHKDGKEGGDWVDVSKHSKEMLAAFLGY